MKKIIALLLTLGLLISFCGCSQKDTDSDKENTSSDKGVYRDDGLPTRSCGFKNIDEMLDWFLTDELADWTFKKTFRELNPEQILTIKSLDDDLYSLKSIKIYEGGEFVEYCFENPQEQEINFKIYLPSENPTIDYLKAYVTDFNERNKSLYNNPPELCAGGEVVIFGKARKTYISDYGRVSDKETGDYLALPALFVTDVDGFMVRGGLRGSWITENWDNKYLQHFEFSMQSIKKNKTEVE